MRGAHRLAARLVAGAVVVATSLIGAAPTASACDVGYRISPPADLTAFREPRVCGTAPSVTGTVVVYLLAVAALVAGYVLAARRGAERLARASAATADAAPAEVYFAAAGLTGRPAPPPGQEAARRGPDAPPG